MTRKPRRARGAIWLAGSVAAVLLVGCGGPAATDTQQAAIANSGASITTLVPAGAPANARFGAAVALDGATRVVGAPRDRGFDDGAFGAVYVFEAGAAAPIRLVGDEPRYAYGRAVSLDGDLLAVGASFATYLYRRDAGGTWSLEAKLTGHCGDGRFGTSVAVRGDHLIVGAPLAGCVDATEHGRVFLYQHVGDGTWELQRSFTGRSVGVASYYGWSVDLDGDTAVVGAPGWGEVFVLALDGGVWQERGRVTDPIWGSARRFGESVSLSGGLLAVGAPLDGERATTAGAAYAYRADGAGWLLEAKLLPPTTSPRQAGAGARFGSAVAVDAAAGTLAIGAPYGDTSRDIDEAGAVFAFRRQEHGWRYELELLAPLAARANHLGAAVAAAGGRVLAGEPDRDAPPLADTGAAHLFALPWGPDEPPPPPPANAHPWPRFSYACEHLTCTFTDESTDGDGEIVAWRWNFGDGSGYVDAQHPVHTYGSARTWTVQLRVTDDGGATAQTYAEVTVTAPPAQAAIHLTAVGYKVRGLLWADLTWRGADSPRVDVFRNGVRVATVANGGSYADPIQRTGRGTYRYRVCHEGGDVCSNEATVTFQ